jgi:hypothetical protein
MTTTKPFAISEIRRKKQKGVEAIEFGLFMCLVLSPMIWMFITGMNFLRFIKATDVARSTALMYVKGQDLTVLGTQRILASVASGLDLQVGSTTGTANGSTTGSALIIVSVVEYIGTTTCSSCTNQTHYVFLDRFYIGNKTLQFNGSTATSMLGNPNSLVWSSTTGAVTGTQTDSRAQVPTSLSGIFPTHIGDGQQAYIVEFFYADQSGFGAEQFATKNIYSRVVM